MESKVADPASPVALIAAGGSGERLGAGGPKALVPVAGRPLLQWSLEAFAASAGVSSLVIAVVEAERAAFERAVEPMRGDDLAIELCAGGPTRSHSVRSALEATGLAGEERTILVHDAARPLVSARLIDACVAAFEADGTAQGLVPAAPVSDTIKQAFSDHVVSATLDRSTLWAVQTPQVFSATALAAALGVPPHAAVEDAVLAAATDDASLVEQAGGRVIVLPWHEPNPKITTRSDLPVAERLLTRPPGAVQRFQEPR